MSVEGARILGVRLQIIRETGKGCLGAGSRLTHVAKNQQRNAFRFAGIRYVKRGTAKWGVTVHLLYLSEGREP